MTTPEDDPGWVTSEPRWDQLDRIPDDMLDTTRFYGPIRGEVKKIVLNALADGSWTRLLAR